MSLHNAGMKTFLLFIATALAEIIGCYLPYLWLKQGRSVWLLIPALLSLAVEGGSEDFLAWIAAQTAAGTQGT